MKKNTIFESIIVVMKFKFLIIFLTLLFWSIGAISQSMDSLKLALKNAKHDSTRCDLLNQIIEAEVDNTVWPAYNDQLLKLAQNAAYKDNKLRKKYLVYVAGAINNLGYLEQIKGNTAKTIEYYKQSLKIEKEIKNTEGIARCYNNLGLAFENSGDITNALVYYHDGLKAYELVKNKTGIAYCLNNIGGIYENQGDAVKAFENYKKSLQLFKEANFKEGEALALNNIAFVLRNKGETKLSLDYFLKGLKIEEEIGDKFGMARSYSNIATIYNDDAGNKLALEFYLKSAQLRDEIGDKSGLATTYNNIGNFYIEKKEYKQALYYLNKSMELAKEIGYPVDIKNSALSLADIYNATNNHKLAYENYKLYKLMSDSVYNQETKKQSIKNQLKYEFDKKSAADSVRVVEERKVTALKFKEERTQRFALYGGLALVLVFLIFAINRFRITNRQKNIIEKQKNLVDEKNIKLNSQYEEIDHQKHIIEEHQKEIVDSITYAKRIQEAILPPIELIKEKLPQSFVLYKPKDIVAGDFYWMEQIGDTVLIAAADCTGHGVPGAMVSVVCSNALNRAVKEFHLSDTGAILDKVTDLVLETFEKSIAEVKDGMDISLLSINKVTKEIKWSGANNPLWYFVGGELKEITADKQPIGKSDHRKPFTSNTIDFVEGTSFYLFTDGYADQFGGPKGKKFKYKQFQETLLSSINKEPFEQQEALNQSFEIWKGDLEQVDDVCVIGIKI